MISKFYYRLGLFLGITGSLIGITGFIMRYFIAGDRTAVTFINYSLCFAAGLLVVTITLRSKRNSGLRYYSKQYQTMLLYILGTVVSINSGDLAGVIIFIIALVLAYRYSFLASKMLLLTLVYNCALLLIHELWKGDANISIVHELLFVIVIYAVFYFIYIDFSKFLRKRYSRLKNELDIARRIVPFGAELKKRLTAAEIENVEFTRKEYEVMLALCFYRMVSNEELAGFMNISVATVKSHLNNIFLKTGIHSRSRLIAVYKDVFADRRIEEPRSATGSR